MMTFKTFIRQLYEKNLPKEEISKLIQKATDSVRNVLHDTSKSSEYRSRAGEVLKWIESVRNTHNDRGSLHPNTVTGLYRIVAGVSSGRFGHATQGYHQKGDGKVPKDFRRENKTPNLLTT
jgi:hypothetical protein